MMRTAIRSLVCAVVGLQLAVVILFAVLSLDGDDLGIARSMAILMAAPLLALSIPAVVLAFRTRMLWLAMALAAASAVVSVLIY